MNRKTLGTIVALLFALAVLLGLSQRSQNPFTREKLIPRTSPSSNKDLHGYYDEAKNLAKTENQTSTVTFLAVGDISLSRNIAQTIKQKGDPLYPFHGVNDLLKSTDFNFGNLETPFSQSDAFTAHDTLVFNAPKANVKGLVDYNFKVLNLANNHAFDQGLTGVTTTKKVLDDNNLLHMGTGKNLDEAWTPVVYEVNGIKVGFIGASYSSINDGGKATNNYVARIEDTAKLKSVILNLKSTTDFIVVTMHAGTEYTRTPNKGQIDFARNAIDAGADIVIGHHPHWVQTIEEYKGKKIYYSLGNFIFDQSWSEETKKGLALKITLSKLGCHSGIQAGIQNQNLDARSQPGMTCADNLQGPHIHATIQSIQETPISIKENCCAFVDTKK